MASGWQACLIAQRVLLFFYFFSLRGSGAWESGDRHSVIRFSLFRGPGWLSCDCKQSCSTVGRLCGREAVPECVSGSAGRTHLNNPGFSVSLQEGMSPSTSLPTLVPEKAMQGLLHSVFPVPGCSPLWGSPVGRWVADWEDGGDSACWASRCCRAGTGDFNGKNELFDLCLLLCLAV